MYMTVYMTFFFLCKLPRYNACMLYIGQMLCIPAFQLHVWTAVNLDGSQDTAAIVICLGLPHTAVHLTHNLTTAPILLLPFKHNTSHLLGQTGVM